jgi:2-dehydropantoate 2-reductase
MITIALLGAGGVGGFLAAALTRGDDDVRVIARPATAAAILEHGLEVRSAVLGDFHAHPAAATELAQEVEVLLVATKAVGLDDALERIRTPPQLVVPLLNGIDHLTALRERFGRMHVAAGVIRVEADRPQPGLIIQSSPNCRIDLAAAEPRLAQPLMRLSASFQAVGIPTRIDPSEAHAMWSKLARLCPLSLTTSASGRSIGFVRDDPRWRSALEGALQETVRVANAEGAQLRPRDTLAELRDAHPQLTSSMQRDIAAGRPPELDAIAGAVLRAAQRRGVRCPTVRWLADRVAKLAGVESPRSD